MLHRSFFKEVDYEKLFYSARDVRGNVSDLAFPNLFITIAPAEWRLPFLGLVSTFVMSSRIFCLRICFDMLSASSGFDFPAPPSNPFCILVFMFPGCALCLWLRWHLR